MKINLSVKETGLSKDTKELLIPRLIPDWWALLLIKADSLVSLGSLKKKYRVVEREAGIITSRNTEAQSKTWQTNQWELGQKNKGRVQRTWS